MDTPVSSDRSCYWEGRITKMEAPQFRAQSERAGWAGACWVGRWKEGRGQEVTAAEEWEGDMRPDTEGPVKAPCTGKASGLSCGYQKASGGASTGTRCSPKCFLQRWGMSQVLPEYQCTPLFGSCLQLGPGWLQVPAL